MFAQTSISEAHVSDLLIRYVMLNIWIIETFSLQRSMKRRGLKYSF